MKPIPRSSCSARNTSGEKQRHGKRVAALRQATAKNGVKPIWCRAYGKTGTADPKKGGGYNSGWFTGWKEPIQPGGRRFADRVHGDPSRPRVRRSRFGGAVCGASFATS